MKRIRIGVIGLRFGLHHVRTLVNMEQAELVAVADSGFERAETCGRQYGVATYADGVEMMEKEQLDAVSICTSPTRREPLIDAGTSRKLALFIEKPWAADLEQAHRLAKLCRDRKALVMAGFSFRFHPAVVRLQELMSGELGEGWMLNGSYVFGWLPPADGWLWDPAKGGGFFNENSCHLFDVVCALMGEPVSVSAEGGVFAGSPSEDGCALTMRFASGGIAALTIGGIGGGGDRNYPRLEVVTTNGQARLTGREHIWEELAWSGRKASDVQRLTAPVEALGATRYTHALSHFLECVKTGKEPTATVEDGVRSVSVAMGVYESIRTGSRVEVKGRSGG